MGRRDIERWSNPLAALAVSRSQRSRGLVGWVLAPVLLAGPMALLFSQQPTVLTPILHLLLLGRSSPDPGEAFVLPIVLVALLLLTVIGTIPQATLGIARQRERRTLEPLLLTRMSPAAILWGELVQVLLTPVLASLALMPVICLSYCLGGISIARILAVAGALLLCHLFFAVLSLCASSWCRRSGVALFLGYSAVLLTIIGTLLVRTLQPVGAGLEPGWIDGILAMNPVMILLDIVVPLGGLSVGGGVVSVGAMGCGAYVALSLSFFALAAAGLRRR